MADGVAQVVFRVRKLKTAGDVGGALGHNRRRAGYEDSWKHADPARRHLNATLVAPEPVSIAEVVRRKTGKPPRKNAVLATQVVISASPEYFRPEAPKASGTWDEDRLQAWRDAVEPWIREKFPHAYSIELHLDERTPHYHIIDLPLYETEKGDLRLAHKVKYGSKRDKKLEQWQDWAAEPVAHLGIERGERGSADVHTTPWEWRRDQAQPAGPIQVEPPPILLTQSARADWAAAETARVQQAFVPVVEAGLGRKVAERRAKEAARKGSVAQKRARHLEAERDELQRQLKAERDRLREIPLRTILADWGLDSDPQDPDYQWHGLGHRISIERGQSHQDKDAAMKWYDHQAEKGGGGAFDLVMHLDSTDFQGALRALKSRYGADATIASMLPEARRDLDQIPAADPYAHPEPSPDDAPALERWLTDVRGIGTRLARKLIDAGLVYASRVGRHINATWPGVESAELRGIGEGSEFKCMSPGSRKDSGGWQVVAGGRRGTDPVAEAVITESALDAVSYHELQPRGVKRLLMSTAGARSRAPWVEQAIRQHAPQRVLVAYDADETGDRCASAMIQRLRELGIPAERARPEGAKDWNGILQLQRDGDGGTMPDLDQIPTTPASPGLAP